MEKRKKQTFFVQLFTLPKHTYNFYWLSWVIINREVIIIRLLPIEKLDKSLNKEKAS